MTVYGYTRVSTERQADEGESLDVQQRQIGGYAMMKGLEIGRVFVDRGVSGSTRLTERPQGAALLAALEPGDVVVTAKLDRMFRSALDALDVLAQLKERGISLHMVTWAVTSLATASPNSSSRSSALWPRPSATRSANGCAT